MKITFTKRTIKTKNGEFSTIETNAFNTTIRASRSLCDHLKTLKPQMDGTSAVYDIPEGILTLTAQVKNGFTNFYLTIKKEKPTETTEGDLPF